MAGRIEDYALLGDCRTAALVARNGSIDWLCLPRFDSGACLAALLGTRDHGHWQIEPADEIVSSSRRYRGGTLILETEFTFASGAQVRIIDFMPPAKPASHVMRIIEGVRGISRMKMDLTIRFDYGASIPWVRHKTNGIRATAGPDTLFCRSDVEMHGEGYSTVAEFTVSEGERKYFELTWSPTHSDEPQPLNAEHALFETEAWWSGWSGRCKYEGPWRAEVLRSLITLKALTYAPTGGIVAAPTTSLPESIGGVRNWDYRFCWLRDATFTIYALMIGGYVEEAYAWQQWLINAAAGTPSQLQIMYGLAGERRLTELELDWLPGYENSKPVRIGNAAFRQHQLDVYGEVVEAMHVARRFHLPPDSDAWDIQRALTRFVETDWRRPDEGIWEIRGPQRHFTHSKVMAWVALDRAVKDAEQYGLRGDITEWSKLRDEIHADVCQNGFDTQLNSFVQYYGAKVVDASLLMLPLVGFLPASDPRMVGTVALVQSQLMRNGFVDRYATETNVDGLPVGEGSFLLCTFWLADNLALQGRHEEAVEIFERLLAIRNDVGLLAEEFDPTTGRMLGNFPQAFSHVGLINTVRNLARGGGPAVDRPNA